MQVTLDVVEGPAKGHTITVKTDESIVIGRSRQADFSIPSDEQLSGRHFSLTVDPSSGRVHDLNSLNHTWLNGQVITDRLLKDGDRLRAGGSKFAVRLEQTEVSEDSQPYSPTVVEFEERAPSDDTADKAADPVDGFHETGAMSVVARFNLGELLEAAPGETHATEEFITNLRDTNTVDALKFTAYALNKRAAVWWACHCLRTLDSDMSELDQAAIDAAESWVTEPTEDNRRTCMAAAEALEYGTSAAWAAVGAFWSNGSIAPPEAPEVPAADNLTGQAISGSVQLAAVQSEPERAPERHATFINAGLSLGRGEMDWPGRKPNSD